MFIRFDKMYARDRQTDTHTQTDRHRMTANAAAKSCFLCTRTFRRETDRQTDIASRKNRDGKVPTFFWNIPISVKGYMVIFHAIQKSRCLYACTSVTFGIARTQLSLCTMCAF